MSEFEDVQISKADLILAIRRDCTTFFAFYLQDELTLAVPDFHEDVWNELLGYLEQLNQGGAIQSLHKLFTIPREHAKSTIAKLAAILFLKYSPLSFLLYVSKSQGIAKNAVRDILGWLQSQQERELFGGITAVIKASETEAVWIFNLSIIDAPGAEPRIKRIIIRAIGSEQQVRGTLIENRRPDFIILDDIEDIENTTTELQPKLDRWLFGSLLKSFAKRYFVLMIGNMIRDTTILARLSKEPKWNPTVLGCIIRGADGELRPLWQGRHTLEALLEEYRYYKRLGQGAAWEAEMMNLTQDAIFKAEMNGVQYVPVPNPEDISDGIIILDPAFGDGNWTDDSAITVHAHIKGRSIPCVVESVVGKYTEVQLFEIILELAFKWGITTWGIEAEAAQRLLISLFNLYLSERRIREGYFLILPLTTSQKSKASRILAFRDSVKTGNYGVAESEEDLVFRLGEYTPQSKKHDDLCDSAAYGLIVWEFSGQLIESRGVQHVALQAYGDDVQNQEAQYGTQISNW